MTPKLMLLWLSTAIAFAEPVFQLSQSSRVSVLENGNFEQGSGGRIPNWHSAPQGFQIVPEEGRGHSHCLAVENATDKGWSGASQTIVLNQKAPTPLLIRGWSKAQNVTGGADSGYSLYVDLVHSDNTPLWGQTGNFRTGTHDWQRREFTILPEKPVKSLTLHCLFRGHAGKAWFDDVEVEEISGGGEVALFQGTFVKPSANSAATGHKGERSVETSDGLRLRLEGDGVKGTEVGSRELRADCRGGFLVRDAVAGSGFFGFTDSLCDDLRLKIQATLAGRSNHIAIEGRISDLTGKDRAITLVFGLPLEATGWNWGDDIRRSRAIGGSGEFTRQVAIQAGATGTESIYPIAPVWDNHTGLAIGLDMEHPAVFRVGYQAGLKLLFIAYDFALAHDTERFPSGADFRFVLYRLPPEGGFRAAWEKFMHIFPKQFEVRSKAQGLWMPFTDVSKVNGWRDFGFRYHEGNNNVPWDDEHQILSFRYTEPMTWWMPMNKEIRRALPEALRVRDEMARGKDPARARMAAITRVAAMQDEAGEPALLFRDTPWANGAVWSLNPNPALASPGQTNVDGLEPGKRATNAFPLNAATVYWNDAIKERLYGPGARGQLDGEYLDSLEGYVTAELNFRRDHFRFTTVPLTFSTEEKRPALFKGLAVFEFTRWLARDVHGMGKLMFANGVPYRFCYLCPWLDVLGTETDWLSAGTYRPVALETSDLWRTLSGGKPYLLLMNADYDLFKPELVEQYFQRALFYGMWPGFFSHNAADNPYWQNPRWYERDRPLFRRYIPLIRQVAEAGWQPQPRARCDNSAILLERFGFGPHGNWYLTMLNPSPAVQAGKVFLDANPLSPLSPDGQPKALLGPAPEHIKGGWLITLRPEQVALWQLPGRIRN